MGSHSQLPVNHDVQEEREDHSNEVYLYAKHESVLCIYMNICHVFPKEFESLSLSVSLSPHAHQGTTTITSTITISQVRYADGGLYYCEAQNQLTILSNTVQSDSVELSVTRKSLLIIYVVSVFPRSLSFSFVPSSHFPYRQFY